MVRKAKTSPFENILQNVPFLTILNPNISFLLYINYNVKLKQNLFACEICYGYQKSESHDQDDEQLSQFGKCHTPFGQILNIFP